MDPTTTVTGASLPAAADTAETTRTPAIEVRDLVVAYDGVTAVDGISFQVDAGEHLTLLGPSGCGKSTTLRAIAGLETPTSGEISIRGEKVFSSNEHLDVPAERRELSMVFQSYAIWPHMSVIDNVMYGLKVRRTKKEEARERSLRALDLVRMREFANRSASKLSGGQQQRVAVARSLAYSPSVVLFDEPLSNLDAKLREQMRLELKILQEKVKVTSLYVTHDQEEALAISDQVIVMNAGRIEQYGEPRSIYDRPASEFVAGFVGTANLISGNVTGDSVGDGTVTVAVDNGELVRATADVALAEGTKVTVGMQSAHLELGEPDPAATRNSLRVVIKRGIFNGDFIQYIVDWAGEELIFRSSPLVGLTPGDEVTVSIAPRLCTVVASQREEKR